MNGINVNGTQVNGTNFNGTNVYGTNVYGTNVNGTNGFLNKSVSSTKVPSDNHGLVIIKTKIIQENQIVKKIRNFS